MRYSGFVSNDDDVNVKFAVSAMLIGMFTGLRESAAPS